MEADPNDAVRIERVIAADGAASELLLVGEAVHGRWLYWLPAMGVPARHYLPLAQALAGRGLAVALHEWRGIGSSDRRAGRRQDWGYRTLLEADLPRGLAAVRAAWPGATGFLGGHSLGGQLAAMYAGLRPAEAAGLVLVASGAPYWRNFRFAWLIGASYVAAPMLTRLSGYFPGRRIGFGGNEARGVVDDWARTGRTGHYAAEGMGDLEAGMAAYAGPVLAVRLRDDWLGPAASLEWLLGKLPRTCITREVLGPGELPGPADHFGWMKAPDPVAARMAGWLDTV
ncbi:alpha/beta hydrolase family protein [Frateuria soli]|uniref:alpha/beta hydrolase family protein n=1 Tax=Frateuria soli TaxID=1542730 RepID=UPI001E5598DA|nr:alpha/beta fold hydrolase [Frateuria soli]UGB37325.1 alpha/beta fold hydrolase [Frateuria soli]